GPGNVTRARVGDHQLDRGAVAGLLGAAPGGEGGDRPANQDSSGRRETSRGAGPLPARPGRGAGGGVVVVHGVLHVIAGGCLPRPARLPGESGAGYRVFTANRSLNRTRSPPEGGAGPRRGCGGTKGTSGGNRRKRSRPGRRTPMSTGEPDATEPGTSGCMSRTRVR